MEAGPASPAGLPASLGQADRALVMGVLNVTPDSFSDGGRFLEPRAAISRGLVLRDCGADLVDVGGESTRPGAERTPVDDELARVLPVVRALVSEAVHVSIDTMRAQVAEAAMEAGAVVVNDVSGGLADPAMFATMAAARRPYVVMHWRGPSAHMVALASYDDVVRDVRVELGRRLAEAVTAGVDPGFIVLDPGLGFAKTGAHNWSLLAHLSDLAALGRPLLVGASRKRFLGEMLGGAAPVERDQATAATSALAAAAGVWCVRVHEPAPSREAVSVAAAWRAAGGGTR